MLKIFYSKEALRVSQRLMSQKASIPILPSSINFLNTMKVASFNTKWMFLFAFYLWKFLMTVNTKFGKFHACCFRELIDN